MLSLVVVMVVVVVGQGGVAVFGAVPCPACLQCQGTGHRAQGKGRGSPMKVRQSDDRRIGWPRLAPPVPMPISSRYGRTSKYFAETLRSSPFTCSTEYVSVALAPFLGTYYRYGVGTEYREYSVLAVSISMFHREPLEEEEQE